MEKSDLKSRKESFTMFVAKLLENPEIMKVA